MPSYTCPCCGHTEDCDSADAAFQAGWDVAPHFTLQPICNLCPSSPVVLQGLDGARARHARLHAAWQRDGRPKAFDVGGELAADGATRAEVEEQKVQIDAIKRLFEPAKTLASRSTLRARCTEPMPGAGSRAHAI